MTQLYIGILAEGSTDYRFLVPIIEKALTNIAFDCHGDIDITVTPIECDKGGNFADYVLNGAQKGHIEYGITILIIHADADDATSEHTYNNKINPALAFLKNQPEETHCKHIAALVPIHETESWMLADKALLINQINPQKNEVDLNIHGNPENFTNPKEKIEEAIRIGRAEMPKRLKDALKISHLYSYLGNNIQIEKLRNFNSFLDFEANAKKVLVDLNLLNP